MDNEPQNHDDYQPQVIRPGDEPTPIISALPPQKSKKPLVIILVILLLAAAGGAGWFYYQQNIANKTSSANQSSTKSPSKTTRLMLDTTKTYGNKYANGILPVGDGKYTNRSPKTGYIDACDQYVQNIKLSQNEGGAGTRGPWFTNHNKQYDITKKVNVQGSVMWQADFSNQISAGTRTITTNDLPSHPTGTFPIGQSDPAYTYDRNPNSIKDQTLTYTLNANPTYGAPQCMGGESGVMLTGIALFNAFDAGARDAGAWEVQDSCNGHPQKEGEYHYHTLSSCIKDVSIRTVIGFALDGFPITGPRVSENNVLTTSDLDECHGITSEILLDGRTVSSYHYVMTEDFPYSVSCFRATPIQPPGITPPASPQAKP